MALEGYELRFAVLRHEGHGEGHFDLLFETSPGSALAAWRSSDWPMGGGSIVEALPAHRAEYLGYEGPISGGRGWVRRIDEGRHRVREETADQLVVELQDGSVLALPRGRQGSPRSP